MTELCCIASWLCWPHPVFKSILDQIDLIMQCSDTYVAQHLHACLCKPQAPVIFMQSNPGETVIARMTFLWLKGLFFIHENTMAAFSFSWFSLSWKKMSSSRQSMSLQMRYHELWTQRFPAFCNYIWSRWITLAPCFLINSYTKWQLANVQIQAARTRDLHWLGWVLAWHLLAGVMYSRGNTSKKVPFKWRVFKL